MDCWRNRLTVVQLNLLWLFKGRSVGYPAEPPIKTSVYSRILVCLWWAYHEGVPNGAPFFCQGAGMASVSPDPPWQFLPAT